MSTQKKKKLFQNYFPQTLNLKSKELRNRWVGAIVFSKMVGKGFLVGIPEEMLDFEGSWWEVGEEADKVVKLGHRDTHI